jgi:hypothetical protein
MLWPSLLRAPLSACLCALLLLWSTSALGDQVRESTILTLWPLIDYRSSAAVDYRSLSLLGPLIKYERKGKEREFSLRPLLHRARDVESGAAYGEYLYPLAGSRSDEDLFYVQIMHLFEIDFGPRETGEDEAMLFPFLFYGETGEDARYFAFFPFGGRLEDKFGRDEIRFTLFPLYLRTERGTTVNSHFLWPIFGVTRGEEEWGWRVWPLYGASSKEGVYHRRFYLWPIFFRHDLALDSDNPRRVRAAFPFYYRSESPQVSTAGVLWPFFRSHHDRSRNFREWDAPWPLVRITRGEHRHGNRFLPFYSLERTGDYHRRWIAWPLFRSEWLDTELLTRRRHSLLFFLYSDLHEQLKDEELPRKRRISFWPFYTFEERQGVRHFYTLSLLEPIFQENEGIRRNWSPLWRLYQRKWDRHGNKASSLLWNLYWKERRGKDVAMEVFPFFSYRREAGESDLRLLKGLFRYRKTEEGGHLNLFFLPWGIGGGKAGGD